MPSTNILQFQIRVGGGWKLPDSDNARGGQQRVAAPGDDDDDDSDDGDDDVRDCWIWWRRCTGCTTISGPSEEILTRSL